MARRIVRQPLTNEQDKKRAMLFYLTHCHYETKYDKILMNGYNDKGETIGFVVDGYQRYFFLQFHSDDMNPIKYPERVNSYLRWLERQARMIKTFHIPKQGNILEVQSQYNSIHNENKLPKPDEFYLINRWAPVDNHYKTMYGWTPDMLTNIIQVWVNQPKVCDAFCFFIESREYILLTKEDAFSKVVRIFEGQNMPDDLQFRGDRGLVIDQYCHVLLQPYKYSRHSSIDGNHHGEDIKELVFYQDHEVHCHESCFYPLPPNTPTPPPLLRTLSHDIEAVGKNFVNPYTNVHQTRFPVPLWRPKTVTKYIEEQYAQYEIMLNRYLTVHGPNSDEYKTLFVLHDSIKALLEDVKKTVGNEKNKDYGKPWSNLVEWYQEMHPKYEHLEPYMVIPDPLDTDPAIMIVTALNIYNQPRPTPLHFADSHAFVFTNPKMKKKIDRSRQPNASAAINDEYDALKLHCFGYEQDMIAAFCEYIHEVKPSVFTGWNIDTFDFPFLWERCQFYHIYQSDIHKYVEHDNPKCKANPFGTPNFGLLREIPCKYIEGKAFFSKKTDEDGGNTNEDEDGNINGGKKKKTNVEDDYYIDEESGKKKKKSTAKSNPARLSQAMSTHIMTPFVTHMDGIVVWRNASFGVKSVFENKGSTPQYGLDNVCAIELKYPNSDRPRRKLQVSHGKTEDLWLAGGQELWFFICYCYVDATLPLFLLEKFAKVQLLFSVASICNCAMDVVYNNGMQSKISCLVYEQCRRLFEGKYLVPEWGRRGLHWPDVWLSSNPYEASFKFHYLRPRPFGTKGYMGALVMDPSRLLHLDPILTGDFTSLYPSLSASYEFDYNKFLTEATIKHYGLKANQFVPQVLGPQKVIFCGELTTDPLVAQYDQYRTSMLKTTYWKIQEEGIMSAMIKMLFDQRSYWKVQMAKWTYYSKFMSIEPSKYPTNDPSWDRNVLVPLSLKEKLGRFWENMFKAALNTETWVKEKDMIVKECQAFALPGESNWNYVADTQIEVANCAQLGFKLILNSMYGFTTASLDSATLPLMELGASITSQGRRIIRMTGSFCESLTVSVMKDELNRSTPSVWPFTFSAKTAPRSTGNPLLVTRKANSDPSNQNQDMVYPHEDMIESSVVLWQDSDYELDTNGQLVTRPQPDLSTLLENSKEEIKKLYEKYHRADHFQLHGGDTDSVMIGHSRKYCENGMNLTLKMAGLMVSTLNRFLRGCMGLTHEKTAIRSLFVDPKNYFMSVLNQKKLLCKGVEIVRGDTLLFVNRILSKAADDLIHKLDVDHFEAAFMRTFRYIQLELYRFVQGQIPISELILHRKLAKINYVNAPEHVKVAEKMRMRGERVEVGDFIEYVYARNITVKEEQKRFQNFHKRKEIDFLNRKGGDIAESVNFVIQENIPLDLEHYWNSCIVKPVGKFFRHIIAPKLYPPAFETLSFQEQAKVKAYQKQIKDLQFKEVNVFLFAPLEKILLERCEMDMRKTIHIQSIASFYTKTYTLECQYCNLFFEATETKQKLCDTCNGKTDSLREDLKRQLKKTQQEYKDTETICRECVTLTGFPEMDIEQCTKYDCEVFETKSRLKIDKKQFEKKLDILDHITIEYEDDEEPAPKKRRVEEEEKDKMIF